MGVETIVRRFTPVSVKRRLLAAASPAGQDPVMERDRHDNAQLRLIAACVLRTDSNAIDVGAHTGDMVAMFEELAPRGLHFALEPIPHMATALATRFPNVRVLAVAASDEAGAAEFTYVTTHPGYSGFKPVPLPTGASWRLEDRAAPAADDARLVRLSVETIRLDAALPPGYAPRLIKIDVEGAEHLVLRGAINTLRAHRPVVVFEHGRGGAPAYGCTPEDLFDLLHEAGMRIFDLDGVGPFDRGEFRETYEAGTRWNFMASS